MAMHSVNDRMSTWTERFNFQDVPYWTPENPSDTYARINYIPTRPHPYLEDRSFIRLQDVTDSYTFPQTVLSKLVLVALRPYVSANNLRSEARRVGKESDSTCSTWWSTST